MTDTLRRDAEKIYTGAINACLPDAVVREALADFVMPRGRLVLVSVGKAAWRMASVASEIITERLGGQIYAGAVITKYGHAEGDIPGVEIYEAAHPVPDVSGIRATERVLKMTESLNADDAVLFLISGGGSALFEAPLCSMDELTALTRDLLASGADINEINAVRKHISRVKGGRFACHVAPARVFAVILSDVLGSAPDVIASGPVSPDVSTSEDVLHILEKYKIEVSQTVREAVSRETPKSVENVTCRIGGSVSELCSAAETVARSLGYKTEILTDRECGEAKAVGERLARLAVEKYGTDTPLAFILGGETVVKLRGTGMGGRNQELALAAAPIISGYDGIALFSVGSDGTDGPTDAAGGYVCGATAENMRAAGIDPTAALDNNDSYTALKAVGGLIVTGPTGTNVNDFAAVLIKK